MMWSGYLFADSLIYVNGIHSTERASAADLDSLRSYLHAALIDSNPKRVKGYQAMIDGIRVDARDQIEPTFCVPTVRIESGYMELVGIEPTTSCMPCKRSPS
jgi:hypothetical protein